MKKKLIRSFVKVCAAYSGKTEEQLARDWRFYHFLYRSRIRAYWLAVTN